MGGHTMACDKQRLRGVMEEMLQAGIHPVERGDMMYDVMVDQ